MAAILQKLASKYQELNDFTDSRTKDFWVISTPLPLFILIISYIYFCQVLGPKLMENKNPFNLNWIIRIFDVIQVIINLYIFYKCLTLGWMTTYSWTCQPIDHSMSQHALEVIDLIYIYFLMKVADLLDTVFFVLKKKQSHISFLHLYHHAGMAFGSWVAFKFFPGGHVTFVGFINSFVHAVMYTYYLVASFNPNVKNLIGWKKRITQLQMFQFFCILLHMGQLFISNPCNYPMLPSILLVPQNLFMLLLFYDFYRKAYRPKKTD